MFKRFRIIFLLLIFTNATIAQLRIKYNGNDIDLNKANIRFALIKDNVFTANTLNSITSNEWQPLTTTRIKLNKLSTSIWLKIPVKDILQYGEFDFLKINNPHINFLRCWITKADSVVKEFAETGDNTTFYTRALSVTNFDFPINSREYRNAYIIIVADKRFTNLALPVNFCSENYYISTNQNANLITGLIAGIIVLILFLNISLYIILRQQLFIWYSLYQFFILVYLLADKGLLFKYLYPYLASLNDPLYTSAKVTILLQVPESS